MPANLPSSMYACMAASIMERRSDGIPTDSGDTISITETSRVRIRNGQSAPPVKDCLGSRVRSLSGGLNGIRLAYHTYSNSGFEMANLSGFWPLNRLTAAALHLESLYTWPFCTRHQV